jgi:ribokinase
VGGYGVGFTVSTNRIPKAGETILGSAFSAGPGGKGSNQAIGAARLGADTSLLTAIGRDRFGQDGLALWQAENVSASSIMVVDEAPTMAGFILVEPDGQNRIIVAPGALDRVTAADVDSFRDDLHHADVCLVSLEIAPLAAAASLRIAHEYGTKTILNPAPVIDLPEYVWTQLDYITPNETEAAALAGVDESAGEEALVEGLRKLTTATIILTLGERGALVDDGRSRILYPAPSIATVVDTTGAGDAFSAGFATAIAEGMSLPQATQFANAAGAFSVQTAEVVPSLARRAELNGFMNE